VPTHVAMGANEILLAPAHAKAWQRVATCRQCFDGHGKNAVMAEQTKYMLPGWGIGS